MTHAGDAVMELVWCWSVPYSSENVYHLRIIAKTLSSLLTDMLGTPVLIGLASKGLQTDGYLLALAAVSLSQTRFWDLLTGFQCLYTPFIVSLKRHLGRRGK